MSWPRWMPGGPPGPTRGRGPPATAGWLRARLRLGPRRSAALSGPLGPWLVALTGTGQALGDRASSPAHAGVLAVGTQDLPDHLTTEAEPMLLEATRRLDPPWRRGVRSHRQLVADPTALTGTLGGGTSSGGGG